MLRVIPPASRVVALLSLFAAAPAARAAAPPAGETAIRIHGSDSMLILNRELAAEYSERDPSVVITVEGGGSEAGIAALLADRTDVAAASRPMKEAELLEFEQHAGTRPEELVVALDGLAIYVHEYNPISTLSVPQLSAIMSGEIRRWSEVGGLDLPIEIYNRDKNSGTRSFMQEHVLGKKTFARSAVQVSTTARLTANVSRNPYAIGYGGVAYARGARIIRLALETGEVGVWPSEENVAAGRYPLSRPLFFYVNPASLEEHLEAFMDWVLSPEGQHVVRLVGYYPAPETARARAIPASAPAAPASPAAIRLTPESMRAHGFDVAVALADADPAASGQKVVTLRFSPAGAAIRRIRGVSLRIGADADVPVALDRDLSLRFGLRKGLIATTSLQLAEAEAPQGGSVYTLFLGDFCSAD